MSPCLIGDVRQLSTGDLVSYPAPDWSRRVSSQEGLHFCGFDIVKSQDDARFRSRTVPSSHHDLATYVLPGTKTIGKKFAEKPANTGAGYRI